MSHAGPIGIAQELVAHVECGLEDGDAIETIEPPSAAQFAGNPLQRRQATQADLENIAVQKIGQFPRHVDAAAQKIGALPTAAILRKARNLGVQAEIGRDPRCKGMPRQPTKPRNEVEGTEEADAAWD